LGFGARPRSKHRFLLRFWSETPVKTLVLLRFWSETPVKT
jgi:hypothetical protein